MSMCLQGFLVGVGLGAGWGEGGAEFFAGSGEAGHDGADGDVGDGGDFFVVEVFEFAEEQDFAVLGREVGEGGVEGFDVELGEKRFVGSGVGRGERGVVKFGGVAGGGGVVAGLLVVGVAAVAGNGEEPGFGVFAAEGGEGFEGAEGGVLEDVVGVGAGEVAREVVGRVEVRKDFSVEAGVGVVQGRWRGTGDREETPGEAGLFPGKNCGKGSGIGRGRGESISANDVSERRGRMT